MISASLHYLFLGTFRHPKLYTLSFDSSTRQLSNLHENDATGGHSWLHVSADGSNLYTTVWSKDPRVAAYRILLSKDGYPVVELVNEAKLTFLSGYVTANEKAVFSASGAQCDVLDIDPATGGFASTEAKQSLSFVADKTVDDGGVMDFGGLRNGGHVSLAR